MMAILGGIVAMVIVAWWYQGQAGQAGIAFEKDDPCLQAAKQEARAALPLLWAALEVGDPGAFR